MSKVAIPDISGMAIFALLEGDTLGAEEKFYNEILAEIADKVNADVLQSISRSLSMVIDRYSIAEKCTDLVPIDTLPDAVKIYLVTRRIEGLSATTLSLYELRLRHFF